MYYMCLLLIAQDKCFVNKNVRYSAKIHYNLSILDMNVLWMWLNSSEFIYIFRIE